MPTKDFRSKWWAFNSHIHTVVSSQILPIKFVDCERVEINTPDGDFLEIDVVKTKTSKPVVALFHGLEGNTSRFYIRNLMYELKCSGFSVVAMNFRSCGSKMNIQKRLYHSGETTDYETLFKWIAHVFKDNPIYAVGFSLGANALIKSLAELGSFHPVAKAVAVSPPYDLKLGSLNLKMGFNRVYELKFLRSLTLKLNQKRIHYKDIPVFTGSSLYDFDDEVTAPVHGFENANHYYETCSSKKFLGDVATPLLLIHSKQDTLTPLRFAPFKVIENNPNIVSYFTKKGGHVGFITQPSNWLESTIISWLNST